MIILELSKTISFMGLACKNGRISSMKVSTKKESDMDGLLFTSAMACQITTYSTSNMKKERKPLDRRLLIRARLYSEMAYHLAPSKQGTKCGKIGTGL